MMKSTKPTAACVLVVRDGSPLGVTRKHRTELKFGLPGGKINEDEDPVHAARREFFEETGFKVDVSEFNELYRSVDPTSDQLVITYCVNDPGGLPAVPSTRESLEGKVLWVSWDILTDPEWAAFSEYNTQVKQAWIDKVPAAWIAEHGTGSLRRAREEGMRWHNMYLAERVALEYGYGFDAVNASRITYGEALAEGDDAATTETCYWARALRYRAKRDNKALDYVVCHATLTEDERIEGIAIRCIPHERPHWLAPRFHLVAFTTDASGCTVNPC
mgnify:FL=1